MHVVDRFARDQTGHPVDQLYAVHFLGVEAVVLERAVVVTRRDVAEHVHASALDLGFVAVDDRQEIRGRRAEGRVPERLGVVVGVVVAGEDDLGIVPTALGEEPCIGRPLVGGQAGVLGPAPLPGPALTGSWVGAPGSPGGA
jgi:hypothetical protein